MAVLTKPAPAAPRLRRGRGAAAGAWPDRRSGSW